MESVECSMSSTLEYWQLLEPGCVSAHTESSVCPWILLYLWMMRHNLTDVVSWAEEAAVGQTLSFNATDLNSVTPWAEFPHASGSDDSALSKHRACYDMMISEPTPGLMHLFKAGLALWCVIFQHSSVRQGAPRALFDSEQMSSGHISHDICQSCFSVIGLSSAKLCVFQRADHKAWLCNTCHSSTFPIALRNLCTTINKYTHKSLTKSPVKVH